MADIVVIVEPNVSPVIVAATTTAPGSFADVASYLGDSFGNGSPEGVVTGVVGNRYRQLDGDPGAVFWLKQSGTGNTGWRPAVIADNRCNAQRLLTALTRDADDASMMLISDSTGTSSYPWFIDFLGDFAAQFPAYTVTHRYWNNTNHTYDSPTTVQTGTGSHTLTVYNLSIGGATDTTFLGQYFDVMIRTPSPDFAFISLGHNEAPTIANWGVMYQELLVSLLYALPDVQLCVMSQNPETGTDIQAQRSQIYQELAALYGLGYLDIHQAFEDNGGAAVLNNVDGVHPNAQGLVVWATYVLQAMWYDRYGVTQASGFPWLNAAEEIINNGDFSAWDQTLPQGWSTTGSASVTQDTTNYESPNLYAAKVTGTGVSAATLKQTLNARRLAGNWLTVIARVYVASGQANTCGRIGISDGVTGATTSRVTSLGQGAFRWKIWQQYIDPASTAVDIFLYGDSSAGTGEATFDRVSACIGKVPMLGLKTPAVAFDRIQQGVSPSGTFLFGRSDGAATAVAVNGPAGIQRSFRWTTAAVARWIAQCTTDAESGSNAGSAWRLIAVDDSGTTIDNPITIVRAANGDMTLTRQLIVTNGIFGTTGTIKSGATTLNTASQVIVDALAGNLRNFIVQTGGVTRWRVGGDTTAEGGSDSGTEFVIIARNDLGGAIDTPLTIVRAAGGRMTITRPISATYGVTAPVGANVGDADATLTVGTSSPIQRWATTLTQNRTVTLSTTGAVNGDRFRIVRSGLGNFTLDVGGLKTIPSATAAFVDVSYDGSAWILTAYGVL